LEPKDEVMMKPLKFDGSAFLTVIHGEPEAVLEHNVWTAQEKATHLLTILQVQAANILLSVPARATNEERRPLQKLPAGGSLPLATQNQDTTELLNTTRIRKGHQEFRKQAHCWLAQGLPTEGGCLCIR
jgi:hypothetical protein